MVISFYQSLPLVIERTASRVLQYHVSVTSYASMFWARYLFGVLFAYAMMLPYMWVSKLVLQERLYTMHLNWLTLAGVQLYSQHLWWHIYFIWMGTVTSIRSIGSTWKRFLEPLMWVGGMWAPGYAMCNAFPRANLLFKCNPFYYVTEAMRQLFFQSDLYLPLWYSCLVVAGLTLISVVVAYYSLDHRLKII